MSFLKTFLTNQVANEFFYHVRIGISQFGSYKLLHSFFSAENLSDKIKLAPPTIGTRYLIRIMQISPNPLTFEDCGFLNKIELI